MPITPILNLSSPTIPPILAKFIFQFSDFLWQIQHCMRFFKFFRKEQVGFVGISRVGECQNKVKNGLDPLYLSGISNMKMTGINKGVI